MLDIPGVTALLLLAALWIWLAFRARRARNRVVKWAGLVLAGLVALASTAALALSLAGFYKINFPPHRRAASATRVAATPEELARGARFVPVCAACHSPDEKPPLVGRNFFEGGPPFGTLWAPNLTPAGEIAGWSDGEVIRAIREGVHQSGRALIVMPSDALRNLSDADVAALVAYLRSQPAAGSRSPPPRLNILAAALVGSGMAQTSAQEPIAHPIAAPAEGPSAEYGEYLVSILGCRGCHGEHLTGGKSGPGPPAGPDLTVFLAKWTAEEFSNTIRTGVDPYRHALTGGMPWKPISAFASDVDLQAIYAYLHRLPAGSGLP